MGKAARKIGPRCSCPHPVNEHGALGCHHKPAPARARFCDCPFVPHFDGDGTLLNAKDYVANKPGFDMKRLPDPTQKPAAVVSALRDAVSKAAAPANDAVNHPNHYGGAANTYEAIKVIFAWGLDFCLGNTVKYIARAGKKDPTKRLEDLEKARFYLDWYIAKLKGEPKPARPKPAKPVKR